MSYGVCVDCSENCIMHGSYQQENVSHDSKRESLNKGLKVQTDAPVDFPTNESRLTSRRNGWS